MEECYLGSNPEMQFLYVQLLTLTINYNVLSYINHVDILQALAFKYSELDRLIAKIELTDKHAKWLRIIRDLFSFNEERRIQATADIKEKLQIQHDSVDLCKDILAPPEQILKLGEHSNTNEVDIEQLKNLVVESKEDHKIKRTVLDRLVACLASPYLHLKGVEKELFSYCIEEILRALKEFKKAQDIDLEFPLVFLEYITQCVRYVYSCYIYSFDVILSLPCRKLLKVCSLKFFFTTMKL